MYTFVTMDLYFNYIYYTCIFLIIPDCWEAVPFFNSALIILGCRNVKDLYCHPPFCRNSFGFFRHSYKKQPGLLEFVRSSQSWAFYVRRKILRRKSVGCLAVQQGLVMGDVEVYISSRCRKSTDKGSVWWSTGALNNKQHTKKQKKTGRTCTETVDLDSWMICFAF